MLYGNVPASGQRLWRFLRGSRHCSLSVKTYSNPPYSRPVFPASRTTKGVFWWIGHSFFSSDWISSTWILWTCPMVKLHKHCPSTCSGVEVNTIETGGCMGILWFKRNGIYHLGLGRFHSFLLASGWWSLGSGGRGTTPRERKSNRTSLHSIRYGWGYSGVCLSPWKHACGVELHQNCLTKYFWSGCGFLGGFSPLCCERTIRMFVLQEIEMNVRKNYSWMNCYNHRALQHLQTRARLIHIHAEPHTL